MNPVIFNCVLLYLLVILLSLLQSKFRVFKDDPITYVILLIVMPFMVLGKAKGFKTWASVTGLEIFVYTLLLAYFSARRILPKVNEGFIYAYTLLHWYLLVDAFSRVGPNFWNNAVAVLSLYPTLLIIKSSFEHRKLRQWEKITLYYWFLFIVGYSFASQIALSIVHPILTAYEISLKSTLLIFISAIQLYFVSTIFSLMFVAIPFFHLEKGSESFSIRWKRALRNWRKILRYKLDNYIEYQINRIQVLYITCFSVFLFYLDYSYAGTRPYLIIIYTIVLPLIYFYFKTVPEENIEEEVRLYSIVTEEGKLESR